MSNAKKPILMLLVLIMCGVLNAQTKVDKPTVVLNKDLAMEAKVLKYDQSQEQVEALWEAIVANDTEAFDDFLLTKVQYQGFVNDFHYTKPEKRQAALDNIETQYDATILQLKNSFTAVRQATATDGVDLGTLKVVDYDLRLQSSRNYPGGRVILTLQAPDGVKYRMLIKALFEFESQWYVLHNLVWIG